MPHATEEPPQKLLGMDLACAGPSARDARSGPSSPMAKMVGAAGIEPTTSGTPFRRATKLRHAPTSREIIAGLERLSKRAGCG